MIWHPHCRVSAGTAHNAKSMILIVTRKKWMHSYLFPFSYFEVYVSKLHEKKGGDMSKLVKGNTMTPCKYERISNPKSSRGGGKVDP